MYSSNDWVKLSVTYPVFKRETSSRVGKIVPHIEHYLVRNKILHSLRPLTIISVKYIRQKASCSSCLFPPFTFYYKSGAYYQSVGTRLSSYCP